MSEITFLKTVAQYNELRGVETLHPLVTIIDLSKAQPMPATSFNFGLFAVYLKEFQCGQLKYGHSHYDYREGTLVFIAPGQVIEVQPKDDTFAPQGWALLFHPDLIRGTPLSKHMHDYTFFSYAVTEALHMSEQERSLVLECFRKIQYELSHAIDKHSRKLIVANIELFLDYCSRFYDRQFLTRDVVHHDVLQRFEALLQDYFVSAQSEVKGIPTVAYLAAQLHLSPNYFGDLVKKETGRTAQEYIQEKLILAAKEKMYDPAKSVSEVAYELGFKYPQHFTRFFKQQVGVTPNEFRTKLN
jgi:AraC family transcriptional regulator, transcriptional activator of pobA